MQKNVRRRKVLRSLGATAVSAPFVGSAVAADSDDITVSTVTDAVAEDAIQTARHTDAFDSLHSALQRDGFELKRTRQYSIGRIQPE